MHIYFSLAWKIMKPTTVRNLPDTDKKSSWSTVDVIRTYRETTMPAQFQNSESYSFTIETRIKNVKSSPFKVFLETYIKFGWGFPSYLYLVCSGISLMLVLSVKFNF